MARVFHPVAAAPLPAAPCQIGKLHDGFFVRAQNPDMGDIRQSHAHRRRIHPDGGHVLRRYVRGRRAGVAGADPAQPVLRQPGLEHHGQSGMGDQYQRQPGGHPAVHPDGGDRAAGRVRRPDVPRPVTVGGLHPGRAAAHEHRILRGVRRLRRVEHRHGGDGKPGGAAVVSRTGLRGTAGGRLAGGRRNPGDPDTRPAYC